MVVVHELIAFMSTIVAATVFAAVSMRRFTHRWVPTATYVAQTIGISFIIFAFGYGNGGMIELSSIFCGCLIALSPLNVWLSFVHFSTRGLVWFTMPYLCVLLAIVYAAWTDG